jgi:hypothetical protein
LSVRTLLSKTDHLEARRDQRELVRAYLSPEHRDNPEDGCPSAALLDEIGRCSDATKQVFTDGVLAFIDDIAARLAPHDPLAARAAGHLRPVVDRVFPFDETLEALAYVDHGRAKGKVVVTLVPGREPGPQH